MSYMAVDNALWAVEKYLMHKYGVDAARRDMDPLRWYIMTGRASADLEKRIASAKPFMLGRLLHQGGSYDEAIKRVISYVS